MSFGPPSCLCCCGVVINYEDVIKVRLNMYISTSLRIGPGDGLVSAIHQLHTVEPVIQFVRPDNEETTLTTET